MIARPQRMAAAGRLRQTEMLPNRAACPLSARADFGCEHHTLVSLQRLLLDRHGVVERKPAAVGVDSLPGHIARRGRGEKDGDRGDLVGLADAPERRARQYPPLRLLVGRDRLEIKLISAARCLWFTGLERQLLTRRDAFLTHRQDHCDGNVGTSNSGQINYLLFTKKLPCTIESLIRNHMGGR